ncbi:MULTISPECIES: BLUF domain-containing protein [unclassified Stenotrophomonas]|jgi:hypothetical protein|uniref:BLUF domain-containing protein n=1 Tax=unclassified Stenotrophomonas TaxID=196198 RepID=UPI0037141EEF
MALQAIAYTSQAIPNLGSSRVDELTLRAAAHNRIAGVTGVMLFDGSRFLQYIEGPDDGMSVVYARIEYSRSHTGMVELARGRVAERQFPYWTMRWISVAESELQATLMSDWPSLSSRDLAASRGRTSTGLDRLAELAAPYIA